MHSGFVVTPSATRHYGRGPVRRMSVTHKLLPILGVVAGAVETQASTSSCLLLSCACPLCRSSNVFCASSARSVYFLFSPSICDSNVVAFALVSAAFRSAAFSFSCSLCRASNDFCFAPTMLRTLASKLLHLPFAVGQLPASIWNGRRSFLGRLCTQVGQLAQSFHRDMQQQGSHMHGEV